MAAMMNNNGKIIANEIDKIRCEKLKHNIMMQGANIVEVINEDGTKLGERFEGKFDKVLLDTPCSGEGRFLLHDKNTYKSWSKTLVNNLVEIQKNLIKSAAKCIKQNGELVYSTCTLNKKENEEILNYAIKELGFEVVKIDLKIKNSIKGNLKGADKQIENAIKILPTRYMEGFFVSKLVKK